MKIFLGLFLFICGPAVAGTLVCAGKTVHYSKDMIDFGAAPPTGMKAGNHFLAVNGKVLGRQDFVIGEEAQGNWDLKLEFKDEEEVATSPPEGAAGWRVYTANLVVSRAAKKSKTLAEELVTCRETWAFVP